MRGYLRVVSVCLALATSLRPAAASASAPGPAEISVPQPGPEAIFGGTVADRCAWPTAVTVSGNGLKCTGTLVHPRVVMFAAHCGDGAKQIYFGEDLGDPAMILAAEFCMVNPDYAGSSDQEHDWGFCRLDAAITDLPITPVAFGCETEIVKDADTAAIAGFGLTMEGQVDAARKRWALAPIRKVYSESADVGGLGDPGVCPGDSGGPAFVRYPDGSWHTFGIASTVGGTCGGVGTYSLAWKAAPWIEENAGVDITPCHDPDGTWRPSFRCAGFLASEPGVGHGDWPGCAGTPRSMASTTCGAAFDASPDSTAPSVEITTPTAGEYTGKNGFSTAIEIAVDDGDGWGVARVRLKVNGMEQPVVDDEPPFGFAKVDFPAGTWELIAVAEDAAGFVGESEPVTLIVGTTADSDAPTTTDTAGGSNDTGETDDTGDTAAMDGDGGCGCVGDRSGAGALMLLGLLIRRRGARPCATATTTTSATSATSATTATTATSGRKRRSPGG